SKCLYLINGIRYNMAKDYNTKIDILEEIELSALKEVHLLSHPYASALYGTSGSNGVVVITY
ncbi:MAG: hypothetical protein AAF734_09615, partial [Bacteroidota bacterium]